MSENNDDIDNIDLNSSIIFALLNTANLASLNRNTDDDDDEEWTPTITQSKKIPKKRKFVDIKIRNPRPINSLSDLISVLEDNTTRRTSKRKKTKTIEDASQERETLQNLIDSLVELNEMVGMKTVKNQIVNQILLFNQKMNDKGMFLHTVLTGFPGTGKTTLCHILAKIYKNMGFLDTDKVTIADRSQLIGQWLGETTIKTKKVLEEAKGGILLIDEAYSLGNSEGRDSFAKECIDCINQYLSDHVDEFVCIIAGYKNDLESCFFSQNRGLERRFPWKYDIEQYKPDELYDIMKLQADNDGWVFGLSKSELTDLIKTNKQHFINNGGDTRVYLDKCKITHARRIFGSKYKKKLLSKKDLKDGLKTFIDLKSNKNKTEPPSNLYI